MSVTEEDLRELAELEARVEAERLERAIERALTRIVHRTTRATCGGVVNQVGADGSKGERGLKVTLSFDASEVGQWVERVRAALEAGDVAEAWRLCEEE